MQNSFKADQIGTKGGQVMQFVSENQPNTLTFLYCFSLESCIAVVEVSVVI